MLVLTPDPESVRMPSRHFLLSLIVTAVVVGLFAIFVFKNGHFELSEEYQVIPDGFILPKGCDIRIDMQTGETYAKLSKDVTADKDIIVNESNNNSDKSTNGAPEYQNITKSRIQSRLSPEKQADLETALTNLSFDLESWDFLEEEAAAMEFGLAVLEAKNFELLREFLGNGNEKALQIISICLQNNPLAVEKFFQLEIHTKELKNLLESENLTENAFKKVLRILESFKVHGNDDGKFIETVKIILKKHFKEHENNLKERYIEIIELLMK